MVRKESRTEKEFDLRARETFNIYLFGKNSLRQSCVLELLYELFCRCSHVERHFYSTKDYILASGKVGELPRIDSMRSIMGASSLPKISRHLKLSSTCETLLAPVITVETFGFFRHQARAICGIEHESS